MIRLTEIKLPLDHAEDALPALIAHTLGLATADIKTIHMHKRSFDARKAELLQVYIVDIALVDENVEAALLARHSGNPHILPSPDMAYQPVGQAPATLALRPVVIGFGPCGIFAALLLAQMGFRPIVLERGKSVRQRTQDTWGLWRKNRLNPESNVQFGEGGAGTFSDGKLYSQIKDPRYLGRKVMQEFVARPRSLRAVRASASPWPTGRPGGRGRHPRPPAPPGIAETAKAATPACPPACGQGSRARRTKRARRLRSPAA